MFDVMMAAGVLAASPVVQSADTVIPVQEGMRLEIRNHAGSIGVTTWRRDAVRIVARQFGGREIVARRSGSVLRVSVDFVGFENDLSGVRRRRGRRDDDEAVDLAITVPAYLHLELSGVETEMSARGTAGDLSIETVEGGVDVRGGNGFVRVRSVEGDVWVTGASGRIHASSSDGDVSIRSVRGEVTAESVDGSLDLRDVDAQRIQATTVDGDVTFAGPIHNGGRYHFSTHDGDVSATIPSATNASVNVSTFEGNFETRFPIQLRGSTRHRFEFTLGDGSAVLELESFDGDIFLFRRP